MMNRQAKEAWRSARRERGGVSLVEFMSGYGATRVNDPEALWSREHLAEVSNHMTMLLVGIILAGVMALYWAASAVEVSTRTS